MITSLCEKIFGNSIFFFLALGIVVCQMTIQIKTPLFFIIHDISEAMTTDSIKNK